MINNPSREASNASPHYKITGGIFKNSHSNNDKSILKRGVSEPPQNPKQQHEELEGFMPERLEASEDVSLAPINNQTGSACFLVAGGLTIAHANNPVWHKTVINSQITHGESQREGFTPIKVIIK